MYIILLILSGLIVGALGRLAIPGPNPMSIPMTIAIGVAGSFIGGIVGYFIFSRNQGPGLLLSVAGAALIVWLIPRSANRSEA